jgi:agmatine deiminase
MPPETARHDRTWVACRRAGYTLGVDGTDACATWSTAANANAIAEFEPVSMVVDPGEVTGASWILSTGADLIEAPLRDSTGFIDWNYVNYLVVNDGVIACGYGEDRADA